MDLTTDRVNVATLFWISVHGDETCSKCALLMLASAVATDTCAQTRYVNHLCYADNVPLLDE